MPVGRRQALKRDRVPREIEIGAELLEEVRAEEEVDVERRLPAGDEVHLVVRHDRDRDVLDDDVADRQRFEEAELDLDRLAEEAVELAGELAEPLDRKRIGELA